MQRRNMDPRLLQAINDVLDGGEAIEATQGVILGAKAGPKLRQKILDAAGKMNASTGTPIRLLKGAAKERATLAAVANGATLAGGGGIAGGQRILQQQSLKIQLIAYGITSAVVVARIGARYASLVKEDQRIARASAAAQDNNT